MLSEGACVADSRQCPPALPTVYSKTVIGICIHLKERLPEAICCCLQTCSIDFVLLVMCIPALIVASANISQLCVY